MRIAAPWIWDGTRDPYPGFVDIEGGQIVDVTPGPQSGDLTFEDAIILPGLVNAHTHLDLTFPPPTPRLVGSFTDWLLSVVERRRAAGRQGLESAAARGVQESIESGTTLVVDYDSGGFSPVALRQSPIRRVILREVIGFQPDPERIPHLEEFLADSPDPEREARGLAPHAPYTVHPELLASVIHLARRARVPWSMHIAEQPFEEEFLKDRTGEFASFLTRVGIPLDEFPTPAATAVELLARGGWLQDPSLLIHANYLADEAIAALAKSAATVVYCPRSHAFFDHAPYPLHLQRAAKVRVALGTDGMLSNGSLSMMEELRTVRRTFEDIPAPRLLAMATAVPRRALQRADVRPLITGPTSLAPGEPADLAIYRVHATARARVLPALLEESTACVATIIAGQLVHRVV